MSKAERLINQLYEEVEERHLYAIVDTGIYKEFEDILDIEDPEHRILFKEDFIEEYESVAPYLVRLEKDEAWSDELIALGSGQTWLTFLFSSREIDSLAEILKERINPYSEKHEREIIMRFYDPRNLSRYFKMHTEQEWSMFLEELGGGFAYIDLEEQNDLHLYTTPEPQCIRLHKEIK